MQLILTVLHLALAIGLVGLILIQHGRGADAGAAFGSGASGTVFGAQGSGSFLTRTTAILATLFFLTSMALAYFAAQVGEPQGLMDGVEPPPVPAVIDSGDVPMPDSPAATFEAPMMFLMICRCRPRPQGSPRPGSPRLQRKADRRCLTCQRPGCSLRRDPCR
jgi:preprotein translocase subunit SecG